MAERVIEFPATCVAHWSTGPSPSCDEHARQIVALGRFMALHVPVTTLTEPAECANCRNEASVGRKAPEVGEG